MRMWRWPEGDDEQLKEAIRNVSEPMEMLQCVRACSSFMFNPDPYYRDLVEAVWGQVERVADRGLHYQRSVELLENNHG